MTGTALVRRPTEDAALSSGGGRRPSASRLIDLLIVARATGDRYGARLFDHQLTRALGGDL